MKITIGDGSDICTGFSNSGITQRIFAEDVVFTFKVKSVMTVFPNHNKNQPRIATTVSSFRISSVPLAMKYRAWRTSPRWTKVSPGGAWVVLNFIERALRQPGEASVDRVTFECMQIGALKLPTKAGQFFRRFRFKWRQMSAWRHSGNPLRT